VHVQARDVFDGGVDVGLQHPSETVDGDHLLLFCFRQRIPDVSLVRPHGSQLRSWGLWKLVGPVTSA